MEEGRLKDLRSRKHMFNCVTGGRVVQELKMINVGYDGDWKQDLAQIAQLPTCAEDITLGEMAKQASAREHHLFVGCGTDEVDVPDVYAALKARDAIYASPDDVRWSALVKMTAVCLPSEILNGKSDIDTPGQGTTNQQDIGAHDQLAAMRGNNFRIDMYRGIYEKGSEESEPLFTYLEQRKILETALSKGE